MIILSVTEKPSMFYYTFQTYHIFIYRSRHINVWNIKDNIVSWTMRPSRKSVIAVATDQRATSISNASVRA